jgi:hypothetical protein
MGSYLGNMHLCDYSVWVTESDILSEQYKSAIMTISEWFSRIPWFSLLEINKSKIKLDDLK